MYDEIDSGETESVSDNPTQLSSEDSTTLCAASEIIDEDGLLDKLFELESLLEADVQRKPKHQKPALQQQWRDEIEQITLRLHL
ncbi:hypothetical protein JCM19240_2022 [Vibrio maritimus]|uniref:Uncharacterized protein n=1 Tax=Vibrio maritimus TaxID=990268 RepID=A0A090T049_9VIBR|nr:hypothetical protein JCM19240_2022 [Vibrio maritimus]